MDKVIIIGIAVAGSIVLLLAALLLWFVCRSYPYKKAERQKRRGIEKGNTVFAEIVKVEVKQVQGTPTLPAVPSGLISWEDVRSSLECDNSDSQRTSSSMSLRQTDSRNFTPMMTMFADEKVPAPRDIHPAYRAAHRSYHEGLRDQDLEAQRIRQAAQRRKSMV